MNRQLNEEGIIMIDETDVKTTANALGKDGVVLIDVRKDEEFESVHAANAIHIPLSEIERDASVLPR